MGRLIMADPISEPSRDAGGVGLPPIELHTHMVSILTQVQSSLLALVTPLHALDSMFF